MQQIICKILELSIITISFLNFINFYGLMKFVKYIFATYSVLSELHTMQNFVLCENQTFCFKKHQ